MDATHNFLSLFQKAQRLRADVGEDGAKLVLKEYFRDTYSVSKELSNALATDVLNGDVSSFTKLVPKASEAQLPFVLNAKDFGAKGDGISDDSTAIQRAITAAVSSNNSVTLDSGKFKCETPIVVTTALQNKKNVVLNNGTIQVPQPSSTKPSTVQNSAMKSVNTPYSVLFKQENDFVIYGPASVAIVDREGDLITGPALRKALPQLLRRARLSLQHLDILVGEILPNYKTGDQLYKTEVRELTKQDIEAYPHLLKDVAQVGDEALFIVGRIYGDNSYSLDVRDDILKGELSCFSISGQAVSESKKVSCAGYSCKLVNEIGEISLSAATICKIGVNQASGFKIIQKSLVIMPKNSDKFLTKACSCGDLAEKAEEPVVSPKPEEEIGTGKDDGLKEPEPTQETVIDETDEDNGESVSKPPSADVKTLSEVVESQPVENPIPAPNTSVIDGGSTSSPPSDKGANLDKPQPMPTPAPTSERPNPNGDKNSMLLTASKELVQAAAMYDNEKIRRILDQINTLVTDTKANSPEGPPSVIQEEVDLVDKAHTQTKSETNESSKETETLVSEIMKTVDLADKQFTKLPVGTPSYPRGPTVYNRHSELASTKNKEHPEEYYEYPGGSDRLKDAPRSDFSAHGKHPQGHFQRSDDVANLEGLSNAIQNVIDAIIHEKEEIDNNIDDSDKQESCKKVVEEIVGENLIQKPNTLPGHKHSKEFERCSENVEDSYSKKPKEYEWAGDKDETTHKICYTIIGKENVQLCGGCFKLKKRYNDPDTYFKVMRDALKTGSIAVSKLTPRDYKTFKKEYPHMKKVCAKFLNIAR